MPDPLRPAVVLLSGGMDSATALAVAQSQGFSASAISFRYGQRHAVELEAAAIVAKWAGVTRHVVVAFDLRAFGGSALTSQLDVPKDRPLATMSEGVPVTYVPARNTIFLSFATAWAETLGALDIFIGANALDYSGYPDCRPEYLQAFETMANLGTRIGSEGDRKITIHAPLLRMTKSEIIATGRRLGVDYSLTRTCYDPSPEGHACGHC
ncbi:MAG: 7-cyano-7-deazaguanine synthase QueC [Gemmatimonadetes bacterium]|nr:7-cyano-7-deazaguanine synthase QueC [Gemmatimonadota bacterium]